MQQGDLFTARKTCLGCQRELPETEFAPIKSKPGKRIPRCRACMNAYIKDWQARHPGYTTASHRRWYAKHGREWEAKVRERNGRQPRTMREEERRQMLERIKASPADVPLRAQTRRDGIEKVYFIQEGDDGPIKIGYTEQGLFGRIGQLQNGNPRSLHLRGAMTGGRDLEAELHAAFGHLRIPGTKEWFSPHEDLLALIEAVATLPRGRKSTKRRPSTM